MFGSVRIFPRQSNELQYKIQYINLAEIGAFVSLTDLAVRQAKPKDKPFRLSDGGGLHLEVRPTGSKVWLYRYWFTPSKGGIYTIGEYPAVGLQAAREARDAARKQVKEGLNPTRERKLLKLQAMERRERTLSAVAEKWKEENRGNWSEGYRTQIERFLQQDLLDTYGDLPIHEVTSKHILDAINKVKARKAASIAKLVKQWAGGIMRYAILHGLIGTDPTYALRGAVKQTAVKHHAHLEANELPEFLRALDGYKGYGVVPFAVKLLLLTFVRTNELRHAEWCEFDLDAGLWRIPAEKMKMKEPHIVPLSRQALEVLAQLQATSSRKPRYLFANVRRPDDCITGTSILRAIELMGFKGQVTGHGFRGTASTILHENGWPSEFIERQLAHSERNKVKASYNHAGYLEQRREMMQWWADYLDSITPPKATSD